MKLKKTAVLFPAAFLMNVNLSLINFSLIFLLKDSLGLNASVIGWYFAVGSAGYTAGCMLLTRVQDKINPALSMLGSVFLMLGSIAMLIRVESAAAALVLYLAFATAPAFFWPQLMGWFSTGLDNRNLGKAVARFNISWSTGALTGPLVGGFAVEHQLSLAFYMDLVFLGLIAASVIAGLAFIEDMKAPGKKRIAAAPAPETHEPQAVEQTEPEIERINDGRGTILRYAGWIGVFCSYAVLGLFNNIFPLFIRDSLGYGESVAGNLLFIRGAVTAAGFILLGKTDKWHFNSKLIMLTQVAVAAVMILLFVNRFMAGFYILLSVFGFLFSLAYSNSIFHGSAGADNRGKRMALHESFLTLGVIAGSVGGGYLYQYHSIYTAFISFMALAIVGFAVQAVIARYAAVKNIG